MGWIRTMALGALGFGIYSSLRKRNAEAQNRALVKPEPLQRWEGEGGNASVANPALVAQAGTDEAASDALGAPQHR